MGTFMKIFHNKSSCMEMYNFPLPSVCIKKVIENLLFCASSPYPIISFVDCVLNMLTSIRPSIELCCLVVFDLSCNVLFCYFFSLFFNIFAAFDGE